MISANRRKRQGCPKENGKRGEKVKKREHSGVADCFSGLLSEMIKGNLDPEQPTKIVLCQNENPPKLCWRITSGEIPEIDLSKITSMNIGGFKNDLARLCEALKIIFDDLCPKKGDFTICLFYSPSEPLIRFFIDDQKQFPC